MDGQAILSQTLGIKMTELELKIIGHAKDYYEGRTARDQKLYGITDAEFDSLIEQLRLVKPDSEILTKTGWGYEPEERKRSNHIGSLVRTLDKFKAPDPIPAKYNIVTPKLDGVSMVLYYTYGELVKAMTSGDGVTGIVCTSKLEKILSAGRSQMLERSKMLSIRGEVITKPEKIPGLKDRGYSHPRNYAAGVLNRDDLTGLDDLEFIAYSIRIWDNIGLYDACKSKVLGVLEKMGFSVPPMFVYSGPSIDPLQKLYDDWKEKYPIDGVVLTVEDIKINNDNFEEDSIAYKFLTERAQGTVGKINWTVGDSGRIVPTIELDPPVWLNGATITNIHAYNAGTIKTKKIGKGAIITLERANEIIPYLLAVNYPASSVVLPENCPICGKPAEWKGLDLVCVNMTCNCRRDAVIKSLLEDIIPLGLGDSILAKLVGDRDIHAFLKFCNDCKDPKLLERNKSVAFLHTGEHAGGLIVKLLDEIAKKFNGGFTFDEFWKIVRLPGLGHRWAKFMIDIDPRVLIDHSKLDVFPSNIKESVIENENYVRSLTPYFRFTTKDKTDGPKMRIAVTGDLSIPRKEFERKLPKGVELGGITKETAYLVCNASSNHNKTKKAIELGIPIITEAEFYKKMGGL